MCSDLIEAAEMAGAHRDMQLEAKERALQGCRYALQQLVSLLGSNGLVTRDARESLERYEAANKAWMGSIVAHLAEVERLAMVVFPKESA